jgi:hypothetical protein
MILIICRSVRHLRRVYPIAVPSRAAGATGRRDAGSISTHPPWYFASYVCTSVEAHSCRNPAQVSGPHPQLGSYALIVTALISSDCPQHSSTRVGVMCDSVGLGTSSPTLHSSGYTRSRVGGSQTKQNNFSHCPEHRYKVAAGWAERFSRVAHGGRVSERRMRGCERAWVGAAIGGDAMRYARSGARTV